MNKDKYLFNTKRINTNRFDSKVNIEKNKKNIKDILFNKDTFLNREKRVKQININNLYNNGNDQIKTDYFNNRDNRNKKYNEIIKNSKTINNESNRNAGRKSPVINQINYIQSYNKIKINLNNNNSNNNNNNNKINQNYKKNFTLNNCNIYEQTNISNPMYTSNNYYNYNGENNNSYFRNSNKEKRKNLYNISNIGKRLENNREKEINRISNKCRIIDNSNGNIIIENQNQSMIQNKGRGYRKLQNLNIGNNNISVNNINYKTIEPKINEIYEYNNTKKKLKKKEDLNLINNDKNFNVDYNYNSSLNNSKKTIPIKLKNITGCNFHKNNSTSTLCYSPKKMNYKRTNDDNTTDYDNNENNNGIFDKKQFVYRKAHRNDSCVRSRTKIKSINSEFTNEKRYMNKSITKDINKEISFNSPNPQYFRRNDRNSVNYVNSVKNNTRICIHKNNIKDSPQYKIDELFNRNNKEKSISTTIQNSDEELISNTSTIKNSNKKYYYQNYINKEKFDEDNNNNKVSSKNKTNKMKQNQKNIIYGNNFNSFDKNYKEEKSDYNKDNLSHYNIKKLNTSTISDYNIDKNHQIKDKLNDDRNNYNLEINNNLNLTTGFQHNLFNTINNKNPNKIIREKKLPNNLLHRKKYNSSFNNEIIINESQLYIQGIINNNNIQKNCNKLVFNRILDKDNSNLLQYKNDLEENNNNKNNNNSFFIKKKIGSSIRNSPKQNINENKNEITPYKKNKLKKENNIDYTGSNSKTKPEFYIKKEVQKSNSRIKNRKNNSIESIPDGQKEIYLKKTSKNKEGFNNSKIIIDNTSPNIIKTFLTNNKVIYHKKSLKIGEFSSTTEIKNLTNNVMNNSILNNSQISIPSSKINISNNGETYKGNNKEEDINNKIKANTIRQKEKNYLIKDDNSYYFNDLKEKINNNFCFYKKYYFYNCKKPINKFVYLEKYIMRKNTKKNEKIIDENNNNISNISENKICDNNNSFSISFNENKINKKRLKNNKETNENKEKTSEEKIFNEQNIISDYESINLEYGSSNDKNKMSNIKKNDNEVKYIDSINFNLDLSEENEENIGKTSKKNLHMRNNTNKLKEELTTDEEKLHIRNLNINLNNNNINGLWQYSNYMSNSTSKKIDKNITKKKDINDKISLLTKKLDDIFKKKNENENENKNIINNNEEGNTQHLSKSLKRKKIKKSFTQKEFALGCSKLNDFFNKKKDNKIMEIKDEIKEEANDELNEEIEIKQKIYTFKLKKKNKLLEDEEENIKQDKNTDKNSDLKNIVSLKKNNLNELSNFEMEKLNIKENPLINNNENNQIKIKIEEKINNQLDLLNINNIENISAQLISILLPYDNSNNKEDINISTGNISKFINIIFDKIINEKIDLGIYSKLCTQINSLLLKESKNNNLEIIIINDYNKKDFKMKNEKLAIDCYSRLNDFILELISVNLIKAENFEKILSHLFEEYQNKKYHKYLYLESIIYLFDSLYNLYSQNPKEKSEIINLNKKFEENLNLCLNDKNMNDILKQKLIDLISKKNKFFEKPKKEIAKKIPQEIIPNKIKTIEGGKNEIVNDEEIKDNKIDTIKDNIEIELNENCSKTNVNFYLTNNNQLNDQKTETENNNCTVNTKKRKTKKKSKSTEKRKINLIKEENGQNINDNIMMNKEEIEKDLDNYLLFLEKEGIKTKENIYDELNDSYNWKVIDDLIINKNVKLEEIIKIFIAICKTKKDINNGDIFKVSEYIKTIIEYYKNNLSKNQIEILHLNMIEFFMLINDLIDNTNNEINMCEIMGNLLYILLKNKLYFMKDLNNFIEKNKDTQINMAKVVKYAIIASGNCAKQYHNDFKYTKLFNNNEIFSFYITNELSDIIK